MAVVTPTDRPKSAHNRCVIDVCGVVCVVTLPFWHFCWCRGFCHRTESDLFLVFWYTFCQIDTMWWYFRWAFKIYKPTSNGLVACNNLAAQLRLPMLMLYVICWSWRLVAFVFSFQSFSSWNAHNLSDGTDGVQFMVSINTHPENTMFWVGCITFFQFKVNSSLNKSWARHTEAFRQASYLSATKIKSS